MGKRGPKSRRKEVAWSPEFAYAIGLITTDGNLSIDGRHLSLVSKDIEQIKNLKKCLALKTKIGIHRSGRKNAYRTYHRVQWGDIVLYDFLLDIGLMPNKSRKLNTLNIPDKYFFDFLRGHFDGDGSFYSYFDPRWKSSFMFYLTFLSASTGHIQWLRESVERLCGVHGHISFTNRLGLEMSSLRYAKRESLQLLAALYPNERVICLKRKRLKIEKALRIVGESLSL